MLTVAQRARAFALACASGALLWSTLGAGLWPIAFVAWAPLLVALEGAPARDAWRLGAAQGLATNLLGFYWLVPVVRGFVPCSWPVAVAFVALLCVAQAGRGIVLALLYVRARARGCPKALCFAMALGASELAYPLLFDWYSAAGVHDVPLLMQLADVGGPILVGVALAGSSVALAELASARLDRRSVGWRTVLAGAAAPAIAVGYGLARAPSIERDIARSPEGRVAIVQPNLAHDGSQNARAAAILRRETADLARTEPALDLVVWPETSLGRVLPERALTEALAGAIDAGSWPPVPLIAGALIARGEGASDGPTVNAAVLWDPGAARVAWHAKLRPLAIGEYVPLGDTFPQLYDLLPNAGRITAGTTLAPLDVAGHRIATLLCYEDTLVDLTNDEVRAGDPDLLLDLANDSWFGRSFASTAHHALAKFRAVEHRRFLVRVTNDGVSAVIDPLGRTTSKLRPFARASEVVRVRWMRPRTPFERLGQAPWWGVTCVIVAIALAPRRRPRTA